MGSCRHKFVVRSLAGLALASALLVSGCSSDRWGFPYRVGTQQGNWITEQQVGLLFQGMTREQVRYALGSPTLTSVLHAQRWDYPYFYVAPDRSTEVRNFSVFFNGDLLERWEGDEQPTLEPFQIARQEVRQSQSEQDQVELDAQQAQAPTANVELGPDVVVSSEIIAAPPSSEPFALPGVPDQTSVPLQ